MNIANLKKQIQLHLQKVCNLHFFHFAIFSNSNQLISKLNEGLKGFYFQLKIIAMTKICITFLQVTPDITSYHALSLLITTYHTLSPRLEANPFSFGYFKISSLALNFLSHLITSSHSLSHLITLYPLGWK